MTGVPSTFELDGDGEASGIVHFFCSEACRDRSAAVGVHDLGEPVADSKCELCGAALDRPNLDGALITSGDIADLVGVNRAAVSNWKKRHDDFPAPAFTDSTGRVLLYWTDQVEAWIAAHFGDLDALASDLDKKADEMRERASRLRSMRGSS